MVNKYSVLFVDDEPNILNGLKRMLRTMRSNWDMEFKTSGQAALEYMENHHVHVIVSDMRMPEMDGAELLQLVSEKHPHIVRIVLSGQADKEDILRSIGPSHQYLSKPCDPEHLKKIIQKSMSLRDVLGNPKISELVAQFDQLPSQPDLYLKILAAVKNDTISLSNIGDIINKDVAMTAQMLKLVNSSYFGIGKKISSINQAVSYLGLELIKSILLSASFFNESEESELVNIDDVWDHSLRTAVLAANISRKFGFSEADCDEAFTAAMLHDCGRIIFATSFPDHYFEYQTMINEANGLSSTQLDREIFGIDHGAVGAYMLGIWGLPDQIVEAVAFHETPMNACHPSISTLTALHLADAIDYYCMKEFTNWKQSKIDRNYVQLLEIEDMIPDLILMHSKQCSEFSSAAK